MWLTIFVVVIILLIVAMTRTEGLWGILLLMINAIFAGLITMNVFEPMANFLDKQSEGLTYFWDFLSLWVIFAMTFAFLRTFTDSLSQTKVRFKFPLELSGSIIASLLTGWIVVCFFLFSLHTAPLGRNSFGKAFAVSPDAANFFLSPDRLWLGFTQSRSAGALSKSTPTVFDPDSEFILKYGQRRYEFEKLPSLTIDTRGRRRR